jgi:hypothetical protein
MKPETDARHNDYAGQLSGRNSMRPRTQRTLEITQVVFAAACLCLCAASTLAATSDRVFIKTGVSKTHREELVSRLRVITGLPDLTFEDDGSLRLDGEPLTRGSERARTLLAQANKGANIIVLEDASSRSDVAFCRVVRGRWARGESNQPPAYVVLIDFKDFHQLSGDAEARAALDVGWGVLHEIDHVVNDSEDSTSSEEIGECENHINAMRLELGLPVRADYFFASTNFKADANFNARYVRLSFERKDDSSLQTKRYWLVWDAASVGGLLGSSQRALVR